MKNAIILILCLILSPLLTGQNCISFGSSCGHMGDACVEDSDCCMGRDCQGGTCCGRPGAELESDEPLSYCCSGQSRTGVYGPYCCATEGTVVRRDDLCCEGLVRHPTTYQCTPPCSYPCYWAAYAVEGGDLCICPDDDTEDGIEVVCPPCSPCTDTSESDCWLVKVFHEGYFDEFTLGQGCRLFGPFCASNETEAEFCARDLAVAAGFSSDWPLVVEIYDEPVTEDVCLPWY